MKSPEQEGPNQLFLNSEPMSLDRVKMRLDGGYHTFWMVPQEVGTKHWVAFSIPANAEENTSYLIDPDPAHPPFWRVRYEFAWERVRGGWASRTAWAYDGSIFIEQLAADRVKGKLVGVVMDIDGLRTTLHGNFNLTASR